MIIEEIIQKINMAGAQLYKDPLLISQYEKLKLAATDTVANWSKVILNALKMCKENWDFKEVVLGNYKFFILLNLDKGIEAYKKLLSLDNDFNKELNEMAIKNEIMILHSTDNPKYHFNCNSDVNNEKITLLSLNRRKNSIKTPNSLDLAILSHTNKRYLSLFQQKTI